MSRSKTTSIPPSPFPTLRTLIVEYTNAVVADSWKGGGRAEDHPIIEKELELARLRLEAHINKMERDLL